MSLEAKNVFTKLNNQEKLINYRKLSFKGDKDMEFDFSGYERLKELFRAIYHRDLPIKNAERKQYEFNGILGALK